MLWVVRTKVNARKIGVAVQFPIMVERTRVTGKYRAGPNFHIAVVDNSVYYSTPVVPQHRGGNPVVGSPQLPKTCRSQRCPPVESCVNLAEMRLLI
jgi:hypothetical protein